MKRHENLSEVEELRRMYVNQMIRPDDSGSIQSWRHQRANGLLGTEEIEVTGKDIDEGKPAYARYKKPLIGKATVTDHELFETGRELDLYLENRHLQKTVKTENRMGTISMVAGIVGIISSGLLGYSLASNNCDRDSPMPAESRSIDSFSDDQNKRVDDVVGSDLNKLGSSKYTNSSDNAIKQGLNRAGRIARERAVATSYKTLLKK